MYVVLKLLTPAILDIGSFEGAYDEPGGAIDRANALQRCSPGSTVVIHGVERNSPEMKLITVFDAVKSDNDVV